MKQKTTQEGSEENFLNTKCVEENSVLSPGPKQNPGIVGSQLADANIVTVTPGKTTESLYIKHKKESAELPEKYKTLLKFFDRMACSLRLLNLCKKSPTFQNISSQVEVMTGRKLSYRHLAQIRYILPEAVQADKILIHDEKTLCMREDMKITLFFDVIEGHGEESDFIALQQVFASRLIDFFRRHPEGCEIPEATLPELFYQIIKPMAMESLPEDTSSEPLSTLIDMQLLNASHLCPSFSRSFSQKTFTGDMEKSQLLSSPVSISSAKYDDINQEIKCEQVKTLPNSCGPDPAQLIHSPCHVYSNTRDGTPMKLTSENDNLGIETPALVTPRRSVPSCDNKLKAMISQKLTASSITVKRSLDFSNLEGEGRAKGNFVKHGVDYSAAPWQKVDEDSCCIARNHATNQSGLISDRQMSDRLSDLVTLIHHIFQSTSCAAMTKQELVHKIIMNNCDILESRGVEEQIELLEKLVPDWICRKLTPGGDLLYNITKVSDLNSVCERLFSL